MFNQRNGPNKTSHQNICFVRDSLGMKIKRICIPDKTKSNQEACFRILVALLGLIAESRMLHKSHFAFHRQPTLLYIRFPYVERERHGALMNKLISVVKDN